MSLYNDLAITAFLEEQLPCVADGKKQILLDLGCGQQPYRSVYCDLFNKVIAADFDVRSKIDALLDARALPFMNDSFDIVLLTEVIEHVDDSSIAFREISRVLKNGGYLLLTWPFICSIHELPKDYVRYTEFGMQRLLQAAGLEIEKLHRRGDIFCVLFAIVEHFSFNAVEFLSRIPWIGSRFFWPIKPLFRRCAIAAWKAYIWATEHARRFHPCVVGGNLKGPVNHLALWTMGYCARVRKVTPT